jgi:hypothetical protein
MLAKLLTFRLGFATGVCGLGFAWTALGFALGFAVTAGAPITQALHGRA